MKRGTSGGIHLLGLAPRQHSSEKTSQRWRGIGNTVSALIGAVFELVSSSSSSDVLTTAPSCIANRTSKGYFAYRRAVSRGGLMK